MNRRAFLSKAGTAALATAFPVWKQRSEPRIEHRLPETDADYQRSKSYIEELPVNQYHWASERAVDAFNDMKFGLRIHWGIYSIFGQAYESWPFLSMPFEQRQNYNQGYKTWNPREFDADAWTNLCQEAGLKMFAFTTKHHEGFSMFDTKTRVKNRTNWTAAGGPKIEDCDLAFSIMETPFRRDVVGELDRRCTQAQPQDRSLFLSFRLVRCGFSAVWVASSSGSIFSAVVGMDGVGRNDRGVLGSHEEARGKSFGHRGRSHSRAGEAHGGAPQNSAHRIAHSIWNDRHDVLGYLLGFYGLAPNARNDSQDA